MDQSAVCVLHILLRKRIIEDLIINILICIDLESVDIYRSRIEFMI